MGNCPNIIANGTCSVSSCPHEHNVTVCEPCGRVFSSVNEFQMHITSKQHREGSSKSQVVSCPLCNLNVYGGPAGWDQHLTTKRHKKNVRASTAPLAVEPQSGITTAQVQFCDFCQTTVLSFHWNNHVKTNKHKSKENYVKYRSAVEDAEKDKNGVAIIGAFNLGFVGPDVATAGKKVSASITTTQLSHTKLVKIQLASSLGSKAKQSAWSVTTTSKSSPFEISITRPLSVVIELKHSFIGRYEDRVEFVFEDSQLKQHFIISRALRAIVGNAADHEALAPKVPYTPRTRSTSKPIKKFVEGVKPPALNAIPYTVKLPRAAIPSRLASVLSSPDGTAQIVSQIRKRFLPGVLDSKSYGPYFKQLLWAEEHQAELDLERYDIHDAILTRNNNYFYLRVPGLAEKRPSVLMGDRMLVQENGLADDKWFEGHVHAVQRDQVGLCFHGSFARKHTPERTYHVRFKLNRIPLCRQHMAMNTAFTEDRVLFPLIKHLSTSPVKTQNDVSVRVYNSLISSNAPQLQAVISILTARPGSLPFIVFGPPGTGKTVTIVEAIRQVLARDGQVKILACAPSNSAADLIASRLVGTRTDPGLNTDELFRFYAPSRFKEQVPDELKGFSYANPDGHMSVPSMARMKAFCVIVTTAVSASVMHGIGMSRGHFSHIFIDEAGYATEPEAFVSIKLMADPRTNIVLSGDPKQLGPIIRSGVAKDLGFETSYLERLMERDAYNPTTGYGKSLVKLTKNFRSHPSILKFPNERFYGNDLEPCGETSTINYYVHSPHLPKKKFPIIFHAVSGKDDREASSPSFFNIDEVSQVKWYVQQLKEDKRFKTVDSDIGIITPYHAQCRKLRAGTQGVSKGIKVGSVEEFQGQERKVIILSTVRSSKEFVSYDVRHTLGFVANPRRFNVAVTRAKALLIVIGDPDVLSLDPLWRSFLNYVYLNGGWTGPDINWDSELPVDEKGGYDKAIRQATNLDMNEFTRRMEKSTAAEVDDDIDANDDHPWPEPE